MKSLEDAPGPSEEKKKEEDELEAPIGGEDEEDALEAFMSGIGKQVQEQDRAAKKSKTTVRLLSAYCCLLFFSSSESFCPCSLETLRLTDRCCDDQEGADGRRGGGAGLC